jgi:hypothetical protein
MLFAVLLTAILGIAVPSVSSAAQNEKFGVTVVTTKKISAKKISASSASADAAAKVTPGDTAGKIYADTYETLKRRITSRGFAPTSLTQGYPGMFVRDSSAQVIKHVQVGDYGLAGRILNFTFGFHAAFEHVPAVHVMNNYSDTAYGYNYLGLDQPLREYELKSDDMYPLISLASGVSVVQPVMSPQTVTAVDVLLKRSETATGTLKATLYNGANFNTAVAYPAVEADIADLPTEASWVRFEFSLPLKTLPGDSSYFIELTTDSTGGEVVWLGVENGTGDRAFTVNSGKQIAISGIAGYDALATQFEPITHEETDNTFFLLHAWYLYVTCAPQSKELDAFIDTTYPIVSAMANYFLTDKHYNEDFKLLLNENIEHSRENSMWTGYDLNTNALASQSLYELSSVAGCLRKNGDADKFALYSGLIAEGIDKNLTFTVDGKKIYAEMYAYNNTNLTTTEKAFYGGFSFINLTPVYFGWYAMDNAVMANTVDAFMRYGSQSYGAIPILDNSTDTDFVSLETSHYSNSIGGWLLANDMLFASQSGDTDRVNGLLKFIESTYWNFDFLDTYYNRAKAEEIKTYMSANNLTALLPESWWGISAGGANDMSDAGNQLMSSMTLYAMYAVSHDTDTVLVSFADDTRDGALPMFKNVLKNGSLKSVAPSYERSGYNFKGWKFDTALYAPGETILLSDSNITLSAVWEPIVDPVPPDGFKWQTLVLIVSSVIFVAGAIFTAILVIRKNKSPK